MSETWEELVALFIERRESGDLVDAETFCKEHPEGGPELLPALVALERTEAMFPNEVDLSDRPSRVGRYRVLDEIGRGGMGRVFRVESDAGDPELALKLLDPLAALNPRARERFRREGALLSEISHPGIVGVHEVEGETDVPFIVMDLVHGQNLSARLADARRAARTTGGGDAIALPGVGPAANRAARVVLKLARAVAFAHERGLLHRDLKPSNVILGEAGDPVLVDFGLAAQEGSATLTESGDLLGTPHYMAPEQARGARADARTDVYGLGAILYELLTLRPPHEGDDPLEVLEHIRHKPVTRIPELNGDVPRDLARIVHRALAWRPDRRYAGAGAFADDLEALLEGRPVSATPYGIVERLEDVVRYRPKELLGAAAVLLLLTVGALFWRSGDASRRTEHEARVAALSNRLDLAWVAKDLDVLGDAARQMLELEPGHQPATLFLSVAERRPFERTGDPAVDALASAEEKRRAGDFEGALADLEVAIDSQPRWALPVAMLGLVAQEAGQLDRAERELTAAVRLVPGSAPLALALTSIHWHRKRYVEARNELDRALRLHPDVPELWTELAKVHARLGNNGEGIAAIEKAIELDGGRKSQYLNKYAALLDGAGRRAEAREIYREMLAVQPDDAVVRFNLAFSLDSDCLLGEAKREYLDALRVEPRDVKCLVSVAHLVGGSKRETCEKCEEAFAADPELYDPEEAEEYLVRALEADDGRSPWLPGFAADVALRVGRTERLAGLLEELADVPEVDERVVRYERALRKLR